MISKELLSEVVGFDADIDCRHTAKANEIGVYSVESGHIFYINIHELAHKCKEWAFSKRGCTLASGRYSTQFLTCTILVENREVEEIQAPTEPEAIFKACEWIMEQNK